MKKIIAIAIALMMALSLVACGGGDNDKTSSNGSGSTPDASPQQEQNTAGPNAAGKDSSSPGGSYAVCYTFYEGLIDKLGSTITQVVEDNNARLEEENPDAAFNDPSYMFLMYMPFLSLDMALTASISEDADPGTIEMVYAFLGIADAKFSILSPGNYQITYTLSGLGDDSKTRSSEELMRYENGSIRYEQRIDGVMDEFYEFISLGHDRYAIQCMTGRAIVTYKDGQITQVLHSVNKYETDFETGKPTEWSVAYDSETNSAWGKTDLDERWVLELEGEGALERIYELKDGTLTISGQKGNYDWETNMKTFEPMEPVVIPASK